MKTINRNAPAPSKKLIAAALAAGALGIAAPLSAQISPWYITEGVGNVGQTYVMQNGGLVNQYTWQQDGEIPIYVSQTYVRQASYQGIGLQGSEYTLAGVPSGGPANFFDNTGLTAYDAGFDGKNTYIVDWGTGLVANYDANFTTATHVNRFQAFQNDLGITVDGSGMVWTCNWGSGMVSQWNPSTGALLYQFYGMASELSALAWDPADNTLWVADANGQIGHQFNLQGQPTGWQVQLPAYVLGGEMPTAPSPGATALLGLSGLVAARRRRIAGVAL